MAHIKGVNVNPWQAKNIHTRSLRGQYMTMLSALVNTVSDVHTLYSCT